MRAGDAIWVKAIAIGTLASAMLATIARWPEPRPESRLVIESDNTITPSQVVHAVKAFAFLAGFPGSVLGMAYALGDKNLSCPLWVIVIPNALVYSVLAHWWLMNRFKQRQSRETHALRN
jgi:hypothetical protein